MKKKLSMLALCACTLIAGTAPAALIDRGGGLIYDTDLNITWLQDANYAKTSGYDADGKMTWFQATAWTDQLVYGGFDNWRLPSTVQPDATCNPQFDGGPGHGMQPYGYNCLGSELGHLFIDLGGIPNSVGGIEANHNTSYDLFKNIQSIDYGEYWSGTEFATDFAPVGVSAWDFVFQIGFQDPDSKSLNMFAWAVRDGDILVAAVPVPSSIWLLASGLFSLLLMKRS